MYQSKIEAAPFNLFDAQTFDLGLCAKGVGTRSASEHEAIAYLRWIADKSGLTNFPECELEWRTTGYGAKCHRVCIGARFGPELASANWKAKQPAQYQTGAYCVLMPGANQRAIVTMETLDDSGAVIATQTLPVEPKKQGIIWDAKAVRATVGPIAKPAKARKSGAITPIAVQISEGPIVAMKPAPAERLASVEDRDALAQQVEQLAATVVKMQGHIDALLLHALEVPGVSLPDVTPIGELADTMDAPAAIMDENMDATPIAVLTSWQGARALHQARADHDADRLAAERARRVRIARRYLAMRSEREAMRGQLYDMAVQLAAANLERDQSRREVARLKAIPHHMGNPVKLDDVQRLTRERDDARARLASTTEEATRLRKSVGQGADMLDAMVERALRAEIALQAVHARQDRQSTPYRLNLPAVSYQVAA